MRLATDSESAEQRITNAKIGVLGCQGRVGSLIVHEIQARHFGAGVSLAGGTVRQGMPKDADFFLTEEADALFECADVLIDFTKPDATAKHIWLAAKYRKPLVIGTTGLSDSQEREIKDAAKETAIVYAANMSVGVNLLLGLVTQAAATFGTEWDIEISETHHKHKVDAPSGTALALGNAAALGRKTVLSPVTDRVGERKSGDIGFSVQRGGDVAGEHHVTFFAEGERLELGHRATNRTIFAKGAIRAALWVMTQNPGCYSMQDVLGMPSMTSPLHQG
ncbi:MAG: 4-hydroxy-tetrahydrodipicolinate reductase [Alphaproteobacteria bacterium CG_4_9_14_3_um_filter_47_13]|nr:MAG: 4-hydroxy-tetrahydrodipicolinate reductase [Alphaproteobacteria bacterium CG_4_9_14_3_um_filter_47_13]